jgi:hypothetical protein
MNPYGFKNLAQAIKACEEFKFNEQITRETLWNAGYELGRSRWYWGPDWCVSLQGWLNTRKQRWAHRRHQEGK